MLEINLGYLEGVYSPNYDKALVHMRNAREILKKLPHEYEETLQVLTFMSQVHSLRGELKQAEELIEEGKKLLPLSRSDLTNEFFLSGSWVMFLLIKGDFEEALQVEERALQLRKKNPKFPAYEIGDLLYRAGILARHNFSLIIEPPM